MEQNKPLQLTSEGTALLNAIVDDLCAGGVGVMIGNEARYRELGIPGIFMRSPRIEPKVIDDAFAAQVWARWNHTGH